MICRDCLYYKREQYFGKNEFGAEISKGSCRRYPPDHDGWPETKYNEFCGEMRYGDMEQDRHNDNVLAQIVPVSVLKDDHS